MEPCQPKPIAQWNPARDVWETPETEDLFCEHLDVFSETWPTSGSMRNGTAYALPTSEPATADGESSLLPTPRATRGGSNTETVELLPTPTTQDAANNGGPSQHERNTPLNALVQRLAWGDYAAAIRRHERMLGRPAPSPTEPGRNGKPRLSAAFAEWMMCLPAGWVTDVPGITRNEALKALGNGVVPQQAATALADMLATLRREHAA